MKLGIFRETLEQFQSHATSGSDPLVDGIAAMDAALNSEETYTEFNELYKDFSTACYLNDPAYGLWISCPSNDFYVRPDIKCSSGTVVATLANSDSTLSYLESITSSYGTDYYVFDFDPSLNDCLMIFDANPNSQAQFAEFNVNAVLLNGSTIVSQDTLEIVDGKTYFAFEPNNPSDSLIVAISRIDTEEASGISNNYELTIETNAVELIGSVSGSLYNTVSKYCVTGETIVDSTETLTIETGVVIEFQGNHKFVVYGRLLAEGTESARITFNPADNDIGWNGVRFINTNFNGLGRSVMDYCDFSYGKSLNSYPDNNGGAVYCYQSSLLDITRSNFNQNVATLGGAIALDTASGINIAGCRFSSNLANDFGGAIGIINLCTPTINNCVFYDNIAYGMPGIYEGRGGAIFAYNQSALTCDHLTLVDNACNSTSYVGGGIHIKNGSTLNMKNSIMRGNYPYGYNQDDDYYDAVTRVLSSDKYNDFSNESNLNINLDERDLCDFTITYSDCESQGTLGTGVIDEDPLFEDYANDNFHITWTNYPIEDSSKSPCIDTGDPLSTVDMDDTVTDMGYVAFYQYPTAPPPPENVVIEVLGNNITINWTGNRTYTYKVYSSEYADTGFTEDLSGTFNGTSWTASLTATPRFYYVTTDDERADSKCRSITRSQKKLIEEYVAE